MQQRAGWQRCNGQGSHDALGSQVADGADCSTHGRAGGCAVVHQDDGLALDWRRSAIAAVERLALLQLSLFARDLAVELLRIRAKPHGILVDHRYASRGDRSESKLRRSKGAQLASNEDST